MHTTLPIYRQSSSFGLSPFRFCFFLCSCKKKKNRSIASLCFFTSSLQSKESQQTLQLETLNYLYPSP
ncbi:hypothetical protein CKAN_01967200 [Cinnamomum micranthum f. kanehirae]|uniref:Uncharacterized protein n=1 Tax=Cinnamomum micranthum f. kanehirae TaxID=337451 RepID=A0A3S3N913_9MAGN|nr:hypothetical protein CKAN_01967200 [Cinnamomum micranthum f. kanehirae]